MALLSGTATSPATADSVTSTFSVGEQPGRIAVNSVTNTVFVTSIDGVTRI